MTNLNERQPRDPAIHAAATLARWLDGRFLDPLLGLLLPGLGDMLGSALGIYPIYLAWQRRAPKVLLARMLLNLAIDALGGAVPIVGDIWDFLFRAHTRNLVLLQARAARGSDGPIKSRPVDTLVLIGAALALLAALAAPVVVVVFMVKWLRG